MKRIILTLTTLTVFAISVSAQDVYEADRARWMEIALNTTPTLHETIVRPVAVVKAVNDPAAYQGWRYEQTGAPDFYDKNFRDVKTVTLDFGRHITGWFSFHTKSLVAVMDAPARFKFTFGEMPGEMNTPFDPWKGSLSRAWMQDETVTLTDIDEWYTIPRRVSFRYLRIELLGASPGHEFAIDDLYLKAVSSAGERVSQLEPGCPQEIRDISRVSDETLRECMQNVFEDGPKRDHRLWSGDLYLQSLANRYSFRNFDLVKHCLYLFAAQSRPDGVIESNLFDTPAKLPQNSYCFPYCLIYNSTLLEYLKDTGDYETASDLWKVALRQIEDGLEYVREDGFFDCGAKPTWFFIDWRDGLQVQAPVHGAMIFALKQTYELATMLGYEDQVKEWPAITKKMIKAAKKYYYDKEKGVFACGSDKQVSILSQAWMIKAGVLNQKEARNAITAALDYPGVVMPGTPYGTHWLIDAMMISGMEQEAKDYLIDYWGGMVRKGADTFWEAYDPDDDELSPYGFFPLNSYCHAWSCTPTYFIGKYPEVFQR